MLMKKKLIAVFIALLFVFTCGFADAPQYADYVADVSYHYKMSFNQDTEISVDDGNFHKTDGQYIEDNVLMVNAAELLPQLGFTDHSDKKGLFSSDAFQYQFVENDDIVVTGGNGYQVGMRMEQAATYKNGLLYIPLSFVIQMATDNTKTSYDAGKNTVKLYTLNFLPSIPPVKTDLDTKIYFNEQLIRLDNVYTVTPKNYAQTFPETLMVPIYEVMPAIGGTATYDSVNRTAVARNDLNTICFPIDTHKYFDFRGKADWSNYRPEIHNDHVYVPVTVINAFVDASKTVYDEKSNTIKFYSVNYEYKAYSKNQNPVPLSFTPVENSQDVRMEQKAQIGRMTGGDMAHVEGVNAYIYEKADDGEDLHGGYGGKDGFYDLGPVGSIINSGNDLTSLRALQLYGKTLIKFQGVFGSHVLSTNYFSIEEGVPKPFLSVDGLTTEMDVNGDGKKEIVAELSGTIPSVNIFKWDGKSLLVSSVDKALGADSVGFDHEDGSFRAYYKANAGNNPDGIAYQYTGNGLELKKPDREVGDVLSENVIDGGSGYEKVIVRMTEGKQYEDDAAGPFMGWNWQGKFAVRLVNAEGKVLSEMELNKIFNPDGEDMIFNRTFLLQFNDYNNDGFPDFVIGQYGSSSGSLYRLFTIKSGKIETLPVKNGESGELFSSGGRSRYTREFDKFAKSGFINWYYNNALGKNIRQNFTWDGAQFVIKPGGE